MHRRLERGREMGRHAGYRLHEGVPTANDQWRHLQSRPSGRIAALREHGNAGWKVLRWAGLGEHVPPSDPALLRDEWFAAHRGARGAAAAGDSREIWREEYQAHRNDSVFEIAACGL